ncbi:glycoside hydrolase family 92 protein [Atractiella rhizophila]|nr:glycoside hydrolase family 92 protein [Atractiella rhizophila]
MRIYAPRRVFLALLLLVSLLLFLHLSSSLSPLSSPFDSILSRHSSTEKYQWKDIDLRLLFKPSRAASATINAYDHRVARWVNPLIGTRNGGHTFAGASRPWGSVKAVADTLSTDNAAGFVSDDSPITGISQLHDDGTGGTASLGNFKLFPTWCDIASVEHGDEERCVVEERLRAVNRVNGSIVAKPGSFKIDLMNGVRAEVATTERAALHRFTYSPKPFSKEASRPALMVDLANDLHHSFVSGNISWDLMDSKGTIRVVGSGSFRPSFGDGLYPAHFCLDTTDATNVVLYSGTNRYDRTKTQGLTKLTMTGHGALIQFPRTRKRFTQLVRIGVSYRSIEHACSYAEDSIPLYSSQVFDELARAGEDEWNSVLGDRLKVDFGPGREAENRKENFWSSLYRTYLSPNNVTGDNPGWNTEGTPMFDSWYCIWDTFRVVHPLFVMLQPEVQAEMVRALIDIYDHMGYLPDCRMSFSLGYSQGGSNADSLLADSYVKNITKGIDWEHAYEAMKKDATVPPDDWRWQGRGDIELRNEFGYVPGDESLPRHGRGITGRTASRMMEYVYNDFSIALVARGLGKTDDYLHFLNASREWENLWNPNSTDDGFHGFIMPRLTNGQFKFVYPKQCSPKMFQSSCYLTARGSDFYEAASWEYSFFPAMHDAYRLIDKMGGDERFVERLDAGWDNGLLDIGNEPAFLVAYMYAWAGRPAKTTTRKLWILEQSFNTSTNGLPGNDDAGSMGAFVVWSYLGLFPLAGTPIYLLSTPLVRSFAILNPLTSVTTYVRTVNFDAGSKKPQHIQRIELDGVEYTRNWITHQELFKETETEMVIELGEDESEWATRKEDRPPAAAGIVDATFGR